MINPFHFWCQKVLPLVYDESLSYYEVLCKVVDYLNKVIEDLNAVESIVTTHSSQIADLQNLTNYLAGELEKIKSGQYMDQYIEALGCWIDNNLKELVQRMVCFVSFGINDDGRFVAYIPENWDFLTFDTIVEQDSPCYGHLVLKY